LWKLLSLPLTGQGESTEEGRARGLAELRTARMSHVTETRYEIAPATGLARRVRSSERIETIVGGQAILHETRFQLQRID
jgi:hypothetical protein